MKRNIIAATLLAMGVTASTYAADKPVIFTPAGGLTIYNLSDNGEWGISETAGDDDEDNPKPQGGSIINLSTNTSQSISYDGSWCSVADVTDDGWVVGAVDNVPGIWNPKTDTWTKYPVPAGWDGGNLLSVTPDGHYAVGIYVDDTDLYHVQPLLLDLTTGEYKEVNNLPEVDLNGVNTGQNAFYAISPDGRYCVGHMSQSYWLPVSSLCYIYDTLNDTWWPIGYDYDSQKQTYAKRDDRLWFLMNRYLSCDGQWVTGTAYYVNDMEEGKCAFRYHIESDKFELLADEGDEDYAGNKITNDGTILANAPADNPYPTAYVRYGKFYVSLDEILDQVYNINLKDYTIDYISGSFQAISADGLTAVMTTYDKCYVIKMPETFSSAASKVDLLNRFTPSIPEGTEMNKFSEIKLTFDREICVYNDDQAAQLLDENGEVVRTSAGFALAPGSTNQLVITFRSTTLTPGKKYTVSVPAGMIWLKTDPSIKSEAIAISYIGRENGPVKVVSVTPANGAALSMLNSSTDYIKVTYNCKVAVSENGSATLYDDSDNPVADLVATADGNNVYFYPTTGYYLYKGTNYYVDITEGSVTDLSGEGGSEALRLNYTGTYVRTLSPDDMYVFYNTCDSYDNFLQWKNEIHDPALTPSNWGFTYDNMWLLVRDSEDEENQALAAHSMFTSPAQSDDWLVTPQLFIPDANTYLAFDAQSYLKDKQDVLRVYVYATDAVYNNLSAEITDRMRENGELIIEETLTPGDSEEKLEGDWKRFTYSLADYAGRNIYIAFVNYNYDQSAIFIDNVQVARDINFLITNQTPTVVVTQESQTVQGIMSVISEIANYDGITFNLLDSDKNIVSTISDAAAHLSFGDTYKFVFPEALPLNVGYESDYTIQILSGQTNNSFNFSIKDLTFNPEKRVVLEEFGGRDCPNCPLGILAIDNLLKIYGDKFLPVNLRTYQGTDPLGAGMSEYSTYLNFSAAPTARINRGEISSPMVSTTQGYQFNGNGLINYDGTPVILWADLVAEEMSTAAEAEIDFKVNYDETTGLVEVPCEVKFAINTNNRSISVFGIILEDDLAAVQQNNLYQTSDPNLGEWGYGGIYASSRVYGWRANDVARQSLCGQSYGGTLLPVSNFSTEETYSITLSATLVEGRIVNPSNCKVVAMVIDNATGRIINANEVKFNTSGINDIEVDSDSEAIYYNLQGMPVAHPEPGNIYIRVQGKRATKIIY